MQLKRTDKFLKDFKKLTLNTKKIAIKQFGLFVKDQKHPSLCVKKIKGAKNIFEGRITKSCRFTFNINGNVIILRRIGKHDKTLKNY